MSETPFFVIAGPTAVGKSDIALAVAEKVGGEIVGADAFQIYAGLPLLSASPDASALKRVPHHLVQSIPLCQSFDVAQWLDRARAAIESIHARGKRAIVCGGTGLYLRALLRGLDDLPPSNASLRAKLEESAPENLCRRLLKIEPDTEVDLQNPRRVIRALEIHALTGKTPRQRQWQVDEGALRGVFLWREREELVARIEKRCRSLFKGSVLFEVESVARQEISPTAAKMLGFDLIRQCLSGQSSIAEAEEKLNIATRQYAKRQMTWFRKEPSLYPITLSDEAAVLAKIVSRITSSTD